MLKAIKKLFSTDTPEISFPTSLFIKADEGSLEDAVQQIYNTKKFRKWASFFPCMWVRFDKDFMDVGTTARFYFFLSPFTYKITVTEVIPNRRYKSTVSGLINGYICGEFIQTEDGVLLEHPFTFKCANMLVHKYYNLVVAPGHLPYMRWRYKIFKKNVIKDAQLNKQRKVYNEA